MNNINRPDKLAIDEAQERLDRFYEILLRLDLRTMQRFKKEKEDNDRDDKIT
jgi:hypothetical protein